MDIYPFDMTIRQLTKQLYTVERILTDIRNELRKARTTKATLESTRVTISKERAEDMLRYIEEQRRAPDRGPIK